MKKILGILVTAACLALTGCHNPATAYDVYMVRNYESHVYCTNSKPCTHCESWASLSEDKLSEACSISCTELTDTSSHQHYCVTWMKK